MKNFLCEPVVPTKCADVRHGPIEHFEHHHRTLDLFVKRDLLLGKILCFRSNMNKAMMTCEF